MAEWLIYGASGYTAALIAEEAVRRGERPILAGRSEARTTPLAERLGLPHRVFGLDDPAALAAGLEGVEAVVHCAGPFSATARPMVDACLAAGVHYLDITGEVAVFEAIHARSDEARTAGIVLMPGVGFDVVPTDCVAAMLKDELPDATSLELAFHNPSGASAGTSRTIVEGLGTGGVVRENGKIRAIPMASRVRSIPFPSGERKAVSISWGDVSTAFHSTGIPNIVVYMTLPGPVPVVKLAGRGRRLFGLAPVQRVLKRMAGQAGKGPDEETRAKTGAEVWGEVRNAAGETRSAVIKVPNSYSLTATTAVEIVTRVMAGGVPPGAHTPSTAFGPRFVLEFDGVSEAG
jgi:saccharopine dehydrogenase (NAD+, L-lysine-forming)